MSLDTPGELQSAAEELEAETPRERVNWSAVNQTTRWRATPTTFGPVMKILLSTPPWALGVFLLMVAPKGTAGRAVHILAAAVLLGALLWSKSLWAAARR